MLPSFDREAQLKKLGFRRIVGTDEAGRGPLAGPVVAGAVVLSAPFAHRFFGRINDSKKMTAHQRESLALEIQKGAAWGIGICSAGEIDEMNIRRASWEAMRRAIENLNARFPEGIDFVLVDGLQVHEMEWPWPLEAMIKGDTRSESIAAASILAKTTRDALMQDLARQFPGYGFEKHKGYPTRAHYAALRELGPCPIHRHTFAPVRAQASVRSQQAQTSASGRQRAPGSKSVLTIEV